MLPANCDFDKTKTAFEKLFLYAPGLVPAGRIGSVTSWQVVCFVQLDDLGKVCGRGLVRDGEAELTEREVAQSV